MARPRFRWLAASGVLAVALTVGAVALPAIADDSTGTVTGHFTDAGAAVSASISLRAPDFSFFANTRTDESGGYTFSDVPLGSYTLDFDRDGGPSQFAVQKLNPDEADLITVAAGQTTVVEEQLVPHGSITVDGVSLTVNAIPDPAVVQLSLIEYTLRHTTLGTLDPGDAVHVEGDVIGKYVRQLMHPYKRDTPGNL